MNYDIQVYFDSIYYSICKSYGIVIRLRTLNGDQFRGFFNKYL